MVCSKGTIYTSKEKTIFRETKSGPELIGCCEDLDIYLKITNAFTKIFFSTTISFT